MRYIDANKIVITAERGISVDGLIFIPMIDVHRSIDATPTADVVEVRHGKWHYPPYAPFGGSYEMKRCSICGYKPDFDADNPYSNFCPNCGAKMDGQRRASNDS